MLAHPGNKTWISTFFKGLVTPVFHFSFLIITFSCLFSIFVLFFFPYHIGAIEATEENQVAFQVCILVTKKTLATSYLILFCFML